jgi:NAD(P)H dehydrogenase (quinone)
MIPTLLHHGMIVVGLPYSFQGQMISDEITGCSPYGASTITKPDGTRMRSETNLRVRDFKVATSLKLLASSKGRSYLRRQLWTNN